MPNSGKARRFEGDGELSNFRSRAAAESEQMVKRSRAQTDHAELYIDVQNVLAEPGLVDNV